MPTILVIGATGNTGGGVLQHLASALPASKTLANHRIIGLTRNVEGNTAKELAKLPQIEMVEKDWTLINAEWLQDHGVERLFIASHNGVSQFTDESLLPNYALTAGVNYVVRISTTGDNIGPATPVFYARNHWAIETMLEDPAFSAMKWTSLQPNIFSSMMIPLATGWVQEYKSTGTKKPFRYMLDGDNPVAPIDAVEVGLIAGHLLALDDVTPHASRKYCLVGPEDATGKDVVRLIEKYAGTTVDDVTFRDVSFVEGLRSAGVYPDSILASLSHAPRSSYGGHQSTKGTPTSPEVLALYAPKASFLQAMEEELARV